MPADLLSLAGEDYCYLTTTGRVTGRPHEIEIWFAQIGGILYLLSGGGERADWVRNLRAQAAVGVRIGTSTFEGRARVLERGSVEDAAARDRVFSKYSERGHRDLEDWRERALAVAVDLPGQPSR